MRIETLRDRIDNAKAKIEKKQNTISKKMAMITKKEDKLVALGFGRDAGVNETRGHDEALWIAIDIKNLTEDIERLSKEVEETKKSLEKYEAQMIGEMERDKALKEIPENVKRMQDELVERWDVWDIEYREKIRKDRYEMDYKEFCNKYRGINTYDLMYRSNEQIHNENMQDAKMLILNLINRVKNITGEITDWRGVEATVGTWGMTVLNGLVIGKEGCARVESIFAGGYNIQRLHVRVLVHEA